MQQNGVGGSCRARNFYIAAVVAELLGVEADSREKISPPPPPPTLAPS